MKLLAIALSSCLLMFSGCCAPCGPCVAPVCGPPPLFPHLVQRMRCASGCGDFYLGEWQADPPCCDPCDHCGQYIGPVAKCKPTLRELWGIRYDACRDTGCAHCGHGPAYDSYEGYEGEWVEGESWHEDEYYNAPIVPRGSAEVVPRGAETPTPAPGGPPMSEPSDSGSGDATPMPANPSTPEGTLPEAAPPAGTLEGAPPAPMQTRRRGYSQRTPFARSHRTRR